MLNIRLTVKGHVRKRKTENSSQETLGKFLFQSNVVLIHQGERGVSAFQMNGRVAQVWPRC